LLHNEWTLPTSKEADPGRCGLCFCEFFSHFLALQLFVTCGRNLFFLSFAFLFLSFSLRDGRASPSALSLDVLFQIFSFPILGSAFPESLNLFHPDELPGLHTASFPVFSGFPDALPG